MSSATIDSDTQQYQPYYIPHQGKQPIWMALGLILMMAGIGYWLIQAKNGIESPNKIAVFIGFTIVAVTLFTWFRQVIIENHQGLPSAQMKRSYIWAMGWFIFSEVMFFAIFFGALFYVRTFVLSWLGGEGEKDLSGNYLWPDYLPVWPPLENPDNNFIPGASESMALPEFSSFGVWFGKMLAYLPLWNTIILVSSSVTVHIAHGALKNNNRKGLVTWLGITVALGVIFIILQLLEYAHAYSELGLTLGSGIYGSTFFLLTGFHGFHVTLGTFILLMVFLRCLRGHFSADNHFAFEAASWYWHFVDVVWLGLFIFVYLY